MNEILAHPNYTEYIYISWFTIKIKAYIYIYIFVAIALYLGKVSVVFMVWNVIKIYLFTHLLAADHFSCRYTSCQHHSVCLSATTDVCCSVCFHSIMNLDGILDRFMDRSTRNSLKIFYAPS